MQLYNSITIPRERDLINGILTFFEVLQRIEGTWASYYDVHVNKIINVTKEPRPLNINYEALQRKLYYWKWSIKKEPQITLDKGESELFLKLMDIAYKDILNSKIPTDNRRFFNRLYVHTLKFSRLEG